MDEDKEKEAEKVTEEAEAVQTPEAIETETASETTATEENPESTNEPDYKAMYEKLLSEHTDLQNKYKERFSESADLSEQAQTGVDLANAIDEGDETQISDLFKESGERSATGLANAARNYSSALGGEAGKVTTSIGEKIGSNITKKAGEQFTKTGEAVSDYLKSPKDAFNKYSSVALIKDLFEDVGDSVKKGITTAERNRNF